MFRDLQDNLHPCG